MKVSLEMEQDEDKRVIKASKGSRNLQGLTAAQMQQSLLRCPGIAHGTEESGECLNTSAAQNLNFSGKDSSNNSVPEAAHACLGQVCVPSLSHFLGLPWLSIPCQFTRRFAPPFFPKLPGSTSGARIAYAYIYLAMGRWKSL